MSEVYVYGLHAVSALLANSTREVKTLYVNRERSDKRLDELLKIAAARAVSIEQLTSQTMNQRFTESVHQGVVARAAPLPEYGERDLPQLLTQCRSNPLILILDGITDPHNLGACLRSADAAGVDFVVLPKDKSASVTAVVSKVASGAAESMPVVRVTNLVRAMECLKQEGVWIYGAAGEAESSVYQLDFTLPVALVMGAEGQGMRRLTRERCDGLFSLPMQGSVSSLNVSVATGVSLYEVVRQRCI